MGQKCLWVGTIVQRALPDRAVASGVLVQSQAQRGAPYVFVEGRNELSWPTLQLYCGKRGMEISHDAFKFCVLGTS